jgi:predicted ester cyclase
MSTEASTGGAVRVGGRDRAETNKQTARRAVDEIWNNRNLDFIDACTSQVARGHQAGEGMGPGDLRMALQEIFTAFPDAYMELEMQVAEGDYVVNFLKLTGTHEGDFRGINATGNRIEVRGFSRLHYGRDGKVDDEVMDFDQKGMLEQLGVLPRMETPEVAPREVARERRRQQSQDILQGGPD